MDHRTLEIGPCAYYIHYRTKGVDWIVRLWYTGECYESGAIKHRWVMRMRTDSGDWSRVMDCTPELLNFARMR